MEFSYTKSTDTGTNMVTKDYSKSRMRENRTYGSVRGGQSNLIPSTRLTRPSAVKVVVGGSAANMNKTFTIGLRPMENRPTALRAGKCTPSAACGGVSPRESVSHDSQSPKGSLRIVFACHPGGGDSSDAML